MTGAELRAWREARGWSQETMQKRTGYHQSQLSRWERGEAGRPDGAIPLHVQRTTELLDALGACEAREAQ